MLCAYYVTEILLLVYIFSTPATTPIIPSQSHSTSKPHSTYHTENNTHAHPLRITSTAHARTHASFFSSVSTAVETASSLPPSPLAIRVNPNQRSASSPYTYANVPPAVSFNDPRARRVINATVAGSITAARETHTHTHTHTQREREREKQCRRRTDDDDDDDDDRGCARRIMARVARIVLCPIVYSVSVHGRASYKDPRGAPP